MEPTEQFAVNLRAARQLKSLSQEQLGLLADLHPTEVSRLERAVRDPRLATIVRLARALNVEAAALLRNVR